MKPLGERISYTFSLSNLRCLCNKCLFINQIKLCLCFEKFFLSLIAGLKKTPPIIGDFPYPASTVSCKRNTCRIVENFRITDSVTQKIKYKAPDAYVMALQKPQCISQFTKFPSHDVMQYLRAISKNAHF